MSTVIINVFSNWQYVVMSFGLFAIMTIGLLIFSEYVFLEPYVVAHLPKGTEIGFILIIMLSGLSALVIPMNIYRIRLFKISKNKISGSVFSSFVGSIAGACSCGPVGFAIISTFGSIGATTSAFLTNFEIPIRIGAILLLLITYFTTTRSLKTECNFNRK